MRVFKEQQGFTLLELIVAIGIFSVAATISVSTLIFLASAQRKAINLQNAHDNIRFALEFIAREIRTGDTYLAGCDWALGGCSNFSFRQTLTNDTVEFRLHNGVVEKSINAGPYLPITDPKRSITKLRFYVSGVGLSEQQKVTIVMEVKTGIEGSREAALLNLQTTVSRRKI